MTTIRMLAIAVAAAVFLWTTAPALAGPGGGRPSGLGHGGPPVGRGQSEAVKGGVKGDKGKAPDVEADEQQARKPTGQTDKDAADNPHSNKGGELRGLDRADEVAGEHGDEGRDTARTKQDR